MECWSGAVPAVKKGEPTMRTFRYEVLVTTEQDEQEVTHALAHAIEGAREDLDATTILSLYPEGEAR